MTPPDEALIVERSRQVLRKRGDLHRNRHFLAWFGGIGFVVMTATLALGFYPKLQASSAPDILTQGLAYGFIGALALGCFAVMATGLMTAAFRAMTDGDVARHALLVKYHDALFASNSSTPQNNP